MQTLPDINQQSGSHRSPATLAQVQYLRGIAALLVVYFHTKVYDPQFQWHIDRSFGYGGVDIFFVISGFIMTLNNFDRRQPVSRFLLHRFIRIYPIYWVATSFGIILFLVIPSVFIKDKIDLPYVLFSYLLLPFDNASGTSHGVPFLKIAWTLVFEVYFYLVFAASLLIARPSRRMLGQAAFILSMVAFGTITRPSSAPMGFFTAPLTIEFLFGCLTGLVVGARTVSMPRWGYVALFSCSCLLFVVGGGHGDSLARVFHFGGPATIIVFAAAMSETEHGRTIDSRILMLIGDASYSIYLFHPFILTGVRVLTSHLLPGPTSALVGSVGVCTSVAACMAAGVAVHLAIERPLLRGTRRITERATSRLARLAHDHRREGALQPDRPSANS